MTIWGWFGYFWSSTSFSSLIKDKHRTSKEISFMKNCSWITSREVISTARRVDHRSIIMRFAIRLRSILLSLENTTCDSTTRKVKFKENTHGKLYSQDKTLMQIELNTSLPTQKMWRKREKGTKEFYLDLSYQKTKKQKNLFGPKRFW